MPVRFLFPPKCTFCRQLLVGDETDLCHHCRENAPEISYIKSKIQFVAQWTAVWYYKDDVRKSIHRFKFGNARRYAPVYARHLALKLQQTDIPGSFDLVSWVPISWQRRIKRGYDQSELLARALCRELNAPCVQVLRRVRHTPPQSRLKHAPQRRANVLGAYKVVHPEQLVGKRILLLDDVVTTGATASECAKTLLIAGAKEVCFAAVAAASHDKK